MRRVFLFEQYVNESMNKKAKDALINSFFTALAEILDAHDLTTSYNLMSRNDEDFDAHYKNVLKYLNDEGWTSDVLEHLFMDHNAEIAKIYNKADDLSKRIASDNQDVQYSLPCGVADYVLYKLTNGLVILSGYRPSLNAEFEEKYIRFAYGYATKYKYGKLAITQDFGSLANYIDVLGTEFPKLFNEDNQGMGVFDYDKVDLTEDEVAKNYTYADGIGLWDVTDVQDKIPAILDLLKELGIHSEKKDSHTIKMYWNYKLKEAE